VAVVLSVGNSHTANILPVLAGLGLTSVDRMYDEEARRIIEELQPDLAVAVANPRTEAGARVISQLAGAPIPRLLVFDTSGATNARVTALELGADAFVSARDDAATVRATVAALLRRTGPGGGAQAATDVFALASLEVDLATFEARDRGRVLPLTPTEFRILACLAEQPDRVRSAVDILRTIHDYQFSEFEARQQVKVYIKRLRQKLATFGQPSVQIINARSFGYRLSEATSATAHVAA
jgi:two-component system OmpR family response regulator